MNAKVFKQMAHTMRMLADAVCFRWTGAELCISQLSQNEAVMSFISVPSTRLPACVSVDTENLYKLAKGLRKDDVLELASTDRHFVLNASNKSGSRTYKLPLVDSVPLCKPDLSREYLCFASFDSIAFYRACRDVAYTHRSVELHTKGEKIQLKAGTEELNLNITLKGEGELEECSFTLSSDQLLHIARFSHTSSVVKLFACLGKPLVIAYDDSLFALK